MLKINWQSWLASPALFGCFLLASSSVSAAEAELEQNQNSQLLNQIEIYAEEGKSGNSLNQVTNVNQLRDVSPSDWAYEALRSLVDRYGCIVGYPNQTYRGNQALSRYEFAAGLNACLNQIERLIASSEAVAREDIETLQRLMEEFEAELATISGRVDNLEGRTAFLEDNQFSTTTKLSGEVIFALTDSFGSDDDTQTVLGDRFRLVFDTSFTGEDSLITRLSGGNLEPLLGNGIGVQTFNLGENDNNVDVDWLAYYFPFQLGERIQFDTYVAAFGGIHSDYVPTLNPFFEDFDGGNGALSTFASESPIYRIGGGSGAAVSFQFGALESVLGPSTITVGYLAGEAGSPDEGEGLFNGDYAALGQINFAISDAINIGLTYVRSYFDADTGSFGGDQSDLENPISPIVGTNLANGFGFAKTANTYGAEVAWKVTDRISLSGFFAYQDLENLDTDTDSDVWTWGGGVALPDFGKEGSVLGIFAGTPPYLGDAAENETPIHVEGFYKYQLTDNISITPGVIWVHNPEQGLRDEDEDDEFIGTIRTTFTF